LSLTSRPVELVEVHANWSGHPKKIIIIIVVSDLNKIKQNGTIIIQDVKPKGNSPIISRNLKSYTFA
jgi:hypothetical protein